MATKKSAPKAKTSKPSPEVEERRAAKALYVLRRKVESTASDVSAAERHLRSAKTITASIDLRNQEVDSAEEALSTARIAHAEAVRDFEAARNRS